MEKPLSLTLLYTGGLRGDLRLLPRLYTFLRRLAGPDRPLLLDLGQSCAPEVWPCGVTGGRAALFVLDAMGCHAASVAGLLNAENRARLEGQLKLFMVDERHFWRCSVRPWHEARVTAALAPTDPTMALQILLHPAPATQLEGGALHLAGVRAGQVGRVRLELAGGRAALLEHEILDMPSNTPPEPTIAGTVDFVEDEARYYEKTGGSGRDM